MSAQNPLNQAEPLYIPNDAMAATSSLDSIINIARARRLGLFATSPHSVVIFQHVTALLSAAHPEMGIPDPSWKRPSGRPRTTLLAHISSGAGMSLTDTFSFAVEGSRYGRKGYAHVTDY